MRGYDHVYFQVVSGNGGSLVRPRVAPIEEALGASRFGAPHLVGNARENFSPTAGRRRRRRPFKVDAAPAPDITWVAWLGAAVSPNTAPARPFYLRAPDCQASKGPAAEALAAIRVMIAWLSELWSGGTAVIEPATLRDAARLAQLHGRVVFIADGAKASSRAC